MHTINDNVYSVAELLLQYLQHFKVLLSICQMLLLLLIMIILILFTCFNQYLEVKSSRLKVEMFGLIKFWCALLCCCGVPPSTMYIRSDLYVSALIMLVWFRLFELNILLQKNAMPSRHSELSH